MWDRGLLACTQCSAEEWHGRSTEAPRYVLRSAHWRACWTRNLDQTGRHVGVVRFWQRKCCMVKGSRSTKSPIRIATLGPSSQATLRLARSTSPVEQTAHDFFFPFSFFGLEGQKSRKQRAGRRLLMLNCVFAVSKPNTEKPQIAWIHPHLQPSLDRTWSTQYLMHTWVPLGPIMSCASGGVQIESPPTNHEIQIGYRYVCKRKAGGDGFFKKKMPHTIVHAVS